METKGGRAGHGHSQGVEIEGGRQVMALLWVEIDRGREGHEWPMGGGRVRKGVSWVGHGWRLREEGWVMGRLWVEVGWLS